MIDYSNKTILVTGATGLIGSNLVNTLMKNYKVKMIAMSRSEDKLEECFNDYLNLDNFKYIAHDVSIPFNIDDKVDYIFHAAGPMEGHIISNYPLSVISPNIQGTINCLEILRRQKEDNLSGKMIMFSSITVYANNSNEDRTVKEEDTNITSFLEANNACYFESKRMSEVICNAYRKQYNLDIVTARFSTVYGYTRFIPKTAFFDFISSSINGEDIVLQKSNLPRRDNIYIDDAISAILTIGLDGESGESYNVSSNGELGNYASVDEIAIEIAKHSNKSKVIFKESQQENRLPGLKLDNSKLKKLGWSITTSLSEGINKTINNVLNTNQ